MHRTFNFTKKTRSGKILTITREHYLRDDLYCGSQQCTHCPMQPTERKLMKSTGTGTGIGATQYFVLDTNVLLHQMDLLETSLTHPERGLFTNLILLQTVLDEVRSNNQKMYTRVRAFIAKHPNAIVFCNEHHRSTYIERVQGESPNDRNDRAIRVAANWYKTHLPSIDIVMMTNDKGNRIKAGMVGAENIGTISVPEYVDRHSKEYPDLSELLARMVAFEKDREKGAWAYPEHLGSADLKAGLDSGKLKKGTFKVNRDYWSEASVSIRGGDPVFIPDVQHMNRAIDGDIVIIEILPRSAWRVPSKRIAPSMEEESLVNTTGDEHGHGTDVSSNEADVRGSGASAKATGKVVGIFKRNWRPYCGSLEVSDKKKGTVLFLSVNKRIPKIKISSNQVEALMDKRIMVQIDSWPCDSKFPLGHYTKTLGDIGDKDTETQVLLIEHDIPNEAWSKNVLACLPKDEFNIDQAHCKGRSDFRHLEVMSIDPPNCTDIDDALHCRRLPNGNYEVGVHIADVSHYVRPDTAIDLEGAHRGTSVYLVDKRIDMLPSKLSTNLCSLRCDIDRLTFSVLWELNEKGEILDTTFHKGVIKSVASLTYAQAQERMDSESHNTQACKGLRMFARMFKQRRLDAGALLLSSNEVKFVIDRENGSKPMDVEMYQLKEANSVVEEFMLLANISVGKRILEAYPTFALLRRHPVPSADMFEPLIRAGKAAGFNIKVDTSKHLAESLDKCVVPGFPFFNKLIRMMATRCMTQAIYFGSGDLAPKEFYHYGLACPVYTHFTSPIRRYADIVVHRLLASSLGIDPLPAAVQDRERVHEMAETINHRHRMAQLVSRASSELFTLLFFADKNVEEDAMIVAVKANGIRVMVPRYGIESGITLWQEAAFDEEQSAAVDKATSVGTKNPWQLDDMAMTLTGPGGVKYTIFEQVRVRIYVQESKLRRKWLQIDLLEKGATSKPQTEIAKHIETAAAATPAALTATPAATKKASKKREMEVTADDDEDAPMEDVAPTPKQKQKQANPTTASAKKKQQPGATVKKEANNATAPAKKKQKTSQ